MRITNGTPLVVAPVASRHPQTNRPAMTVAVKGAFRLENGAVLQPLEEPPALSGDVFRDDDPGGECLHASDFVGWKPKADLLLRGTCHVPDGRPTGVCAVRFAVGTWSKTLAVFGPRSWQAGGDSPGLAKPFSSFPLSYRSSFGGPGRRDNPIGVGFGVEILPRIESAEAPIKSRADTPPTAGFGPLNPTWLPRQGKVGTYGGNYARERWPGFPADFDWSYFNAAPEDQQVPFLAGDEVLVLENLRPDAPRLRALLPNWRVRCVIQQLDGSEVRIKELPLVLDTLVVDADEATVSLTWRGIVEVQDEEMEDILEIFVMAESMGEAAAPPEALLKFLSPSVPLLAVALALRSPLDDADGAPKAATGAGAPAPAAGAPAAKPGAAAPPAKPAAGATVAAAPVPPPPGSAPPDGTGALPAVEPPPLPHRPEVAEMLAAHGPELAKVQEAAVDAYARMAQQVAENPKDAPWPGFPDGPVPGATDQQTRLAEAWKFARSSGVPEHLEGEALMHYSEIMKELDNVRDFVANQPPPADPPRPPTPAEVRSLLAEPDAKTAQQLSGADLAGENFSGADLTGSVARDARLSGFRGDKSVFKGVVFAGSDLSGASLRGADLSGADLTGCDLSGADLTGANLRWATLAGACLRGAKLDAVVADHAMFTGADLTGASLAEADLTSADLSKTALDDARAGRANLTEATLHGCHGARADFTEANLTRLRAGEQVLLKGCRFQKTTGPGAIWQAANLSGSDFSGSRMPGALFDKAALTGCRFDGSDLAGARFRKAVLLKASLARVNLFRATMARADLTEADFSRANMFEVDFMEATLRNTLFAGTNLKKTTLAEA